MLKRLMNVFDLRALLPRERRRMSQRETAKGVVGQVAGKPRTEAEQCKRAQRRVHRREMTKAIVLGLTENPAGSKRARRYAKASGYIMMEDNKLRQPTAAEARDWYSRREEAPLLEGARPKSQEEELAQLAWKSRKAGSLAVRVAGSA